MYKSYTLNNIHYFEIDNININNGISYIFSLSELDKLHKNMNNMIYLLHIARLLVGFCNRTLVSINLFDIYYFLNKDLHKVKLAYAGDVVDFISLQVKK